MELNNKSNDIDKYQKDIINFIKNTMQINLNKYDELLLNKLIKAKISGEDLIFIPFIPRTLHDKNIQCKYYGTNAKCFIIDDLDGK